MKYIVILGDGMADHKTEQLGNKTPLEAASKPCIDMLCRKGELGLVKTVPDHLKPGSDVANLSVMGYDPDRYYSGRSPLEAVSIGIDMQDTDIAIRCNLVTLSGHNEYENKTMLDYSAGEISTEEASVLMKYIGDNLGNEILNFYAGISYRHCLIWKNGVEELECTPPHDILDKNINSYLPAGNNKEIILDIQKKSYELLKDHPVNKERINRGLNPANSIWLWGEGKKPALYDFNKIRNVRASVISAVDLIKGIGICAGFRSIDVEGATGTVHTNFDGKLKAIINELEKGQTFIYAHFEAPDECGHQNDAVNKVKSIELIDEKIVAPLYEYLNSKDEDFSIMILPDHPTPLELRTHTNEPVPYIIYRSYNIQENLYTYSEENGGKTGFYISEGYKLMDRFLEDLR